MDKSESQNLLQIESLEQWILLSSFSFLRIVSLGYLNELNAAYSLSPEFPIILNNSENASIQISRGLCNFEYSTLEESSSEKLYCLSVPEVYY